MPISTRAFRWVTLSVGLGLVAGCGVGLKPPDVAPMVDPVSEGDGPMRPMPRPGARSVPAGAVTVEQFDTTTARQRQAAAEAPQGQGGETELGRTIATLGDPADPGFWAKTPLVREVRQGRLVYPANGNSVQVELRPLPGEPGAGSQVSLAAMRVLGAPLTGLPELIVLTQ